MRVGCWGALLPTRLSLGRGGGWGCNQAWGTMAWTWREGQFSPMEEKVKLLLQEVQGFKRRAPPGYM